MGLFDRLFGKKETPKVAEEKLEENLLTETTQKEELSEKPMSKTRLRWFNKRTFLQRAQVRWKMVPKQLQ